MVTAVSAPTGKDFLASLSSPTESTSANAGDMSERFLKLLVTQMQNQDPLNPLDNAQVTTQMAQINTVSGIEKLNQSITSMSQSLGDKLSGLSVGSGLDQLNSTLQTLQGQLLQGQAAQGAALVGRDVLLSGNALNVNNGTGRGAVELSGPADRAVIEVVGPAGQVLDQLDLGALPTGRTQFAWNAPPGMDTQGLTFKVKATSGAATVGSATLSTDTVRSVSAGPGGLVLDLARGGSTPLSGIKGIS